MKDSLPQTPKQWAMFYAISLGMLGVGGGGGHMITATQLEHRITAIEVKQDETTKAYREQADQLTILNNVALSIDKNLQALVTAQAVTASKVEMILDGKIKPQR